MREFGSFPACSAGPTRRARKPTPMGRWTTPNTPRRPSVEVIIVDSGSTDATLDIAREFPTQIIEIPPASFSYGRALNLGVQAASGDYVISLSAHSLPASPYWLTNLLKPFADPTIGAVY